MEFTLEAIHPKLQDTMHLSFPAFVYASPCLLVTNHLARIAVLCPQSS